MQTTLAATTAGDLFSAFNHVETFTAAVISRIPDMADCDVIQTRERAQEMGKAAWRIECACDSEVLKRTQARRGRGNVDTEGVGVVATVNSIAASVGVSPRTIFNNAQIHNTYFGDENTASACSILEDKQFFTMALLAANPVEAVQAMAAKKAENPFYSTRDAQRDVEAAKAGRYGEQPALPSDVYSLILADPPWQYDFSVSDSREIENHYPTMAPEQICALPVAGIAAPDCVLFLWATSPKLDIAFDVIDAWGFTYKTCMIWAKDKIGMGYYARQQHEVLLIATVGTPSVPEPAVRPPSVITAPRTRHSEKPEIFRETIDSMYPNAKKIELFCRSPRPGWAAWGNEV